MNKYFIKLLAFTSCINFCTMQNTYSMDFFYDFVGAVRSAQHTVRDAYNLLPAVPDSVKRFTRAGADFAGYAFSSAANSIEQHLQDMKAERAARAQQNAIRAEMARDARRRSEAAAEQARQAARRELDEMAARFGDPWMILLSAYRQAETTEYAVAWSAFHNMALNLSLAERAVQAAKDLADQQHDNNMEAIAQELQGKIALMAAQAQQDEAKSKREAQEARFNRQHALQMADKLKEVVYEFGGSVKQNPHLYIAAIVTIIGTRYAFKEGFSLASRRFERYLSLPKIVKETNIESINQKIQSLVFSAAKKQVSLKDIVLQSKVQDFMKDYAARIKGAIDNDLYLRGLILHGRPGTGKTLLACILSRMLGIPYYIISAASLFQLSTEEALQEITKLFENAKSQKCIIFLDEAELIFPNRKDNKGITEDMKKVLNHFLSYTGTESTDFVLILATNLLDQFDDAFLSRCDILAIDAPSMIERKGIVEMYVKKYLHGKISNRKPSFVQNILGIEPKSIKLHIELDALNQDQINNVAKVTEGFVGRDISDLVLEMQRAAACKKGKRLTKAMVDQIVEDKVAQVQAKLDIMHKHDAVATA